MATRRRERYIYVQIAWMIGTIVTLSVLGAFSLERFFIGAFVGFLTVNEFSAPASVAPQWRFRLRWLVLLGLLVFGYVVADRLLGQLSDGFV